MTHLGTRTASLTVGLLLLISPAPARPAPAPAHTFRVGQRVEASPLSIQSKWEACEVLAVLPGGDYKVACGPKRAEYVVQARWVRAASGPAPTVAAEPSKPATGPSQAPGEMPAQAGRAPSVAGGGGLTAGSYRCSAAGGVAGTLRLVIKSDSQYADANGKTGTYSYDPASQTIVFRSGPWAGSHGAKLGPRKIGVSSRPGGSYGTTCDLT